MSTPAPAVTPTATPPAGAAFDPVALAESLATAAEKSAKLIGDFAARNAGKHAAVRGDELGLGKAFMELAAKMLANPARIAEAQMNLWWDYMSLWQSSMLRMMGAPALPVAEPAKGDKRFKDEDWHEHFLFDYIKQSYLIAARWLHDQVGERRGHLGAHEEEGRFLHAPVHRCARAVELRAHQSRGVPRNRRQRRPEPRQAASTTCSTTSSAATASCASR